MDRPILMALVLAFLLVLLALMLVGWRRRQRRQAGIPRPAALPVNAGPETLTTDAFYVATTVAGDPLNRIAVAGLGYRARATVGVLGQGIRLSIPGQSPIFIPAASIRAVEKATWTIDRVVEQDGLTLLRWNLGDGDTGIDVDSYLRIADPALADEFFRSIRTLHTTTQAGGRAQ